MSGKLVKSSKEQRSQTFRTSHAFIIGINEYSHGIPTLGSATNDARQLANILSEQHNYDTHLLNDEVTKEALIHLLTEVMPTQVEENDRVLFYFAGHGVALDGEDGPEGYLLPQDAHQEDSDTFLSMHDVHMMHQALPCRHLLVILDCCFAGTFRWANTRDVTTFPAVIYQEQVARFIQEPAWQVITSTAYDQKALDLVVGQQIGSREAKAEIGNSAHSPFALALFDALEGAADIIPRDGGNGIISATELYLFMRYQVEQNVAGYHNQTPGLWPLRRDYDKGEFIFINPNKDLSLPPAPELSFTNNPYRGLEPYEKEHEALFFGRDDEIQAVSARVQDQPFTAVVGASGSGKSSLVKAGLLSHLSRASTDAHETWLIPSPLRPGSTPLLNLHMALADMFPEHVNESTRASLDNNPQWLAELITGWQTDHPNQKFLLIVDQLEELVTLSEEERVQFITLLANAIQHHPDCFRLIVTVRIDFEAQFNRETAFAPIWTEARYPLPPLDQVDLRSVIEKPAAARVLFFESSDLIDDLINELRLTPGALPLLSFTLSEMYIHYIKSGRRDRTLTRQDYENLGGVIGSLRNRANAEYDALPDDPHRKMMQKVMLRMVAIGGGELGRRRVTRTELEYPTVVENAQVDVVLTRLTDARLIVTGEEDGRVIHEPAHDALVLAWDQLLRWKQQAEHYLPLQRRVAQAAAEWDQANTAKPTGLLWDDDPRLPQLEETLWPHQKRKQSVTKTLRRAQHILFPPTTPPSDTQWLNWLEVRFVKASVEKRAIFWKRFVGITTIMIALLTIAALFSAWQANIAGIEVVNRTIAEENALNQARIATTAEANARDAQFIAETESDARATEVFVRTTAQAEAVAQSNVAATRQAEAEAASEEARKEARRARGSELAVFAESNVETDSQLSLLLAIEAIDLAYSHQESPAPGAVQIFNKVLNQSDGLIFSNNAGSVSLSQDGRWLANVFDSAVDRTIRVEIWDLNQRDLAPKTLTLPGEEVVYAEFYPNEPTLLIFTKRGLFTLDVSADEEGGTVNYLLENQYFNSNSTNYRFDDEGNFLLVETDGGNLYIWRLDEQASADPIYYTDEARQQDLTIGSIIQFTDQALLMNRNEDVVQLDLENPAAGWEQVISGEVRFNDDTSDFLIAEDIEAQTWSLWSKNTLSSGALRTFAMPNESNKPINGHITDDGRWLLYYYFEFDEAGSHLVLKALDLEQPAQEPRVLSEALYELNRGGSYIVYAEQGGVRLTTADELAQGAEPRVILQDDAIFRQLHFSHNANLLFIGDFRNGLLLDLRSDNIRLTPLGETGSFVSFSQSERWLVTNADSNLLGWDLENIGLNPDPLLLRNVSAFSEPIFLNNEAGLVVPGSGLKLLSLDQPEVIGLIGQGNDPWRIVTNPDEWKISSLAQTNPISWSSLPILEAAQPVKISMQETGVASEDNRWFALERERDLYVWDLEEQKEYFYELDGRGLSPNKFLANNDWLFIISYMPGVASNSGSGGRDGYLMDMSKEEPGGVVRLPSVTSVQVTNDGQWLIGHSPWSFSTLVIDLLTPNLDTYELSCHEEPIWQETLHPTENLLITSGSEPFICLWELNGDPGIEPVKLEGFSDAIRQVEFSPDGKFLATQTNNEVLIWDTKNLLRPLTIISRNSSRGDASKPLFSPDSRWLVITGVNFAHMYDLNQDLADQIPQEIRIFGEAIEQGLISENGDWLALSGGSGTTLYPISDEGLIEDPLLVVEGTILGFDSENQRFFTMLGTELLIWKIDISSLLHQACQSAGRNASLEEWDRYFPGEPYQETCPDFPVGSEVSARVQSLLSAADDRIEFQSILFWMGQTNDQDLFRMVCRRLMFTSVIEPGLAFCQEAAFQFPEDAELHFMNGLGLAMGANYNAALDSFHLAKSNYVPQGSGDYWLNLINLLIELLENNPENFINFPINLLRNKIVSGFERPLTETTYSELKILAQESGELLLYDNFLYPESSVDLTSGADIGTAFIYAGLSFEIAGPHSLQQVYYTDFTLEGNFIIKADASISSRDCAIYGLILNDASAGITLAILLNTFGEYALLNTALDGTLVKNANWVDLPTIGNELYDDNSLVITNERDRLGVHINDVNVDVPENLSFKKGKLGLVAAGCAETDLAYILFEKLIVTRQKTD